MLNFLNNFFGAFIITGLFFSAIRTVKFRRIQALRYLNLHDINMMTVIALFMACIAISNEFYLAFFTAIFILIVAVYLIIDAVVSMEYGYQLDWQTIKLAWQQRSAVLPVDSEKGVLAAYFSGKLYLLLLPICSTLYFYGLLANNDTILWYGFPVYFGVTLLVLTKSRLNKITFIPWLMAIAGLFFIENLLFKNTKFLLSQHYLEYLFIAFFIALVLLNVMAKFSEFPFFRILNVLAHLAPNKIVQHNPRVKITPQDNAIIDLDLQTLKPSAQHGKLKKSNVILIYLESASSCFMKNSITGEANLPYFEKLAMSGWRSDYHVCITPNTNSSLLAMFSSGYAYTQQFQCLNPFKNSDYQTVFVAASHLHGGTRELIQSIGFEDIFSFAEGESMMSDADFYQQKLSEIKKSLVKKENYFLVLHNQQTHIPYHVYGEPEKSNNFERYQQAMQQADKAIEQLIEKLGISLDDTLIVYTGDHGQSFGEFGFTAHSNSVIKQQINVPFLLAHHQLTPKTIDYSSHFDVLPTIMDLLGLQFQEPIVGRSLAQDNLPFSHILFSENRRGKLPACFAHINHERKLFFDLNYQRFLWLTLQDEVIALLSKQEKIHYGEVMLQALEMRGLINRPFS